MLNRTMIKVIVMMCCSPQLAVYRPLSADATIPDTLHSDVLHSDTLHSKVQPSEAHKLQNQKTITMVTNNTDPLPSYTYNLIITSNKM